MEINYKHELPPGDARARLEVLGEYLHNRHGIKVTWTGDRARFLGKYLVVKIDGEMHVEGDRVLFHGVDPGFLWRKKATSYIEEKLKKYLDPKKSLADLPRAE